MDPARRNDVSDYPYRNSSGPQANGSFTQTPTWMSDLIPQHVIVGKERNGRLRYFIGDHIAVWIALRRHWPSKRPVVWPAIDTISLETGYSATKVKILLRELEDMGAIRRISRGRKARSGGRSSNRYELAGLDGPLSPGMEETVSGGVGDVIHPQPAGLGTESAHELDSQVLEEDPPSQTQKRDVTAYGDIAHESERESITDIEALKAARDFSEALSLLSPDSEAATRWMARRPRGMTSRATKRRTVSMIGPDVLVGCPNVRAAHDGDNHILCWC
jgi:hypothetical protein